MKQFSLLLFFLLAGNMVQAQHVVKVTDFFVSGPFKQVRPITTDTVDVNGKKLDFSDGFRKEIKFYINNTDYTKGKLLVKVSGTARRETCCRWRVGFGTESS